MAEGVSKKRKADRELREEIGETPSVDDESTEVKLAILASLYPSYGTGSLMEALLASDGSMEDAQSMLGAKGQDNGPSLNSRLSKAPGQQASLATFLNVSKPRASPLSPKKLTKRGRILHLYSPEDIAAHTPCSLIHNFLPPELADSLLRELLAEAPSYGSEKFHLFDRDVESPHTFCFYVDNWSEAERQRTEYVYNGSRIQDVRATLPEMRKVSHLVEDAVNDEIKQWIKWHYPNEQKLKYQSSKPWVPNTSFVNCYDGGKETVGYHSDELTYLGPRAVIGSISLGVAREFRVRRIVPRHTQFDAKDVGARQANEARADAEGQIAIHLPHNSLLVMHAEMQEGWKHAIPPAQVIDPHPIAGNKRLNITYRYYRESFHPKFTPRCRCNVPACLRCVQKKEENRGRYMWMCEAERTPGQKGCAFFQWAEFDDEGEPPWAWNKNTDNAYMGVVKGDSKD